MDRHDGDDQENGVGVSPPAPRRKWTQNKVEYRDAARGASQRCETCAYFEYDGKGTCAIVEGKIRPNGVCDSYQDRSTYNHSTDDGSFQEETGEMAPDVEEQNRLQSQPLKIKGSEMERHRQEGPEYEDRENDDEEMDHENDEGHDYEDEEEEEEEEEGRTRHKSKKKKKKKAAKKHHDKDPVEELDDHMFGGKSKMPVSNPAYRSSVNRTQQPQFGANYQGTPGRNANPRTTRAGGNRSGGEKP